MDWETGSVLRALGLTLFAGLATGIGSALAFFVRRGAYRVLAAALGFSAGVMLYVSFVEILPEAEAALREVASPRGAAWAAVASFFGGVLAIALVDLWIPKAKNPHEARSLEAIHDLQVGAVPPPTRGAKEAHLLRMSLFTALAIALHNFPEGAATFLAALEDPTVGVAVAVAIALHNVPEGISVSVPVFYATGSRRRAFTLSFLSGLSEPAGALAVYLVLRPFVTPALVGVTLGMVAGIMVYISLDELLPTAREHGRSHEVLLGLFAGMAAMAASLVLFI